MNTLLKVLLGLGATALVGKVAYEIGKEVGENKAKEEWHDKCTRCNEAYRNAQEQIKQDISEEQPEEEVEEEPKEEETEEKEEKPVSFKSFVKQKIQSIRNLKDILKGPKEGGGVVGQILRNPDGTRIEASIVNGKIHVDIHPGGTTQNTETS